MNDLALAKRTADWRRLKALVLDSVSSPNKKGLQPRAGRVDCVVRAGTPAGLHQSHRERLAGCPGGRLRFHQFANYGGPQAGDRSR
jgi:hypothetical protein